MAPAAPAPNFRESNPPKELATFEQGTYEEVQKELTATAREMAIQLRRKQTLQQLEQLQLDEPGIIRIRRFPSREIAELDSELPEPTELPGWEIRASSSDPASCVYELDASDDIHEPKETTSRIAQPRDSHIEPPFSDLEAVGDLDSRGHLEKMPMIPPGSNISYSAQDIGSQDESRLRSETEAATRNYHGHLTQPNSSNHWGNNEIRSNYTVNMTNYVPIDAGSEPQRHSSSQVHSRNPSGSAVTIPPFDGENESHSLFTDLDTLVKALPARTSCRQK
ncbi:MAG: hypothetical protein L6R42_007920 [Xanthoria sp. 1 TBL-2021]|nr:MAG: hypothetical protein L6R42_007920 [Xanthoria sp. 1 TBL-2021]